MKPESKVRVTLYADHPDDDRTDHDFIDAWLTRWSGEVTIADYSTGGWEHIWDIEAPRHAIQEIPKRFFCSSDWANYPSVIGGPEDKDWARHLEDRKT
jgi:hypothetical protein